MERKIIPIDASHDAQEWTMQGTGERDKQMRVYPWPLPSTHRFEYAWDETGMKRTDCVVAKTEDELFMEKAGRAALEARNAGAKPTGPDVAAVACAELAQMKLDSPTSLPDAVTTLLPLQTELAKLSDADLETRAAMEGVAVKDAKGKKLTKAVVIAGIIEKKK